MNLDADLEAEDVIDWDALAPADEQRSLGLLLWFAVTVGGAAFGACVAWLGGRWLDA